MNIWAKMITALRGGVNEAGEAVVDSQALRILDQEIREADAELKNSKDSLAALMARQKVAEEKVANLKKEIRKHEEYAIKALEKEGEELAMEVAQKIADMQNQLDVETEGARQYTESANKLRTAISQTERNIKRLKQQVDTVKATDSVHKAQAAVAERHSGSHSKLRTAMDSLERIKEKQALQEAQMQAASELAEESYDQSLQEKLQEAGIAPGVHDADEILAKLKVKQANKK